MYNLGGNAKRRKQKKCGGGGIRMAEGTIFTQIVICISISIHVSKENII